MLKINFVIAFRNLRKSKVFTLINVLGLGIGMASCFVIFAFIQKELNYDKFHSSQENIYRVNHIVEGGDAVFESAKTFSRVANSLRNNYPFVTSVCRLHKAGSNVVVEFATQTFREENIMGVDSSFFQLFSFPFIYGSPELALKDKGSVVITKRIAEKYFGDANPIGKELILDGAYGFWGASGYENRISHTVQGVIEDIPANTHLSFDILVSLNLYTNLEGELNNWGDSFYTYFKVEDGTRPNQIQTALEEVIDEHKNGQGIRLTSIKAREIHLHSNYIDEVKQNGNASTLWLLGAVALVILVIAGTNYLNFFAAKAMNRKKELGVRKIFHASRKHLFYQLLVEAFVFNLISLVFAIVLIIGVNPIVGRFAGYNFFDSLQNPTFLLVIVAVSVASTLVSGLYPAIFYSRANPAEVISPIAVKGASQGFVRKSLLVMQFIISAVVIGFTVVLFNQMSYMQQKELGIDINSTLVIQGATVDRGNDSTYHSRLETFKHEVLKNPKFKSIALANFIPGREIRGDAKGYVRRIGADEENANDYYFSQVDYDFMSNLRFKLLAGRFFDEEFATDRQGIIINREACRLLGFETPESAVGQKIHYRRSKTPTIIGVVDDYHQHSLQRKYQPVIFEVRKNPYLFCFIKYEGEKNMAYMEDVEELWASIFPGNPFNYFYLDDFYASQYQSDLRFARVFGLFTFLAVLIASLGMIGLTYFNASNLVKEIGIRKTLGANYLNVLTLLGRSLGLSLLVASLISIPIIYLISNAWLNDYAFRIEVSVWMLLIPVVVLTSISFFVIYRQSIKSFRLNPTVALRAN